MNTLERFLKYVSFDTQSDPESAASPSTEKQKALAEYLAGELRDLGLADAHMDQYGYVYAHLPATPGREGEPGLGFIAHMDTSDGASGADIRARVVRYQGGDLVLNEEKSIVMETARFPMLERYVGRELVVTDGTTLLGSDDKAGIAEIVSAAEYLLAHPELAHGPVSIAFTTDEEVGRGTEHFDLEKFNAKGAYTVDGGEVGTLNYENFNAAAARITVHGLNIHPGSAKNKMKNALLIACELVSLLPPAETPAHTEGREGFYHLAHMCGDETQTRLQFIIRDHDREKFEARKAVMSDVADFLNRRYGAGTVELALSDTYYNMYQPMQAHMYLVENARKAMARAGVTPEEHPIRGGTDGANLTYMGLPCPNLSTGGFNGHGVYEAQSVDGLEQMVEILVDLMTMERS